jgi:hypothetical protein
LKKRGQERFSEEYIPLIMDSFKFRAFVKHKRREKIMETEKKEIYVEPQIIATYSKEELEETIRPHGSFVISPKT